MPDWLIYLGVAAVGWIARHNGLLTNLLGTPAAPATPTVPAPATPAQPAPAAPDIASVVLQLVQLLLRAKSGSLPLDQHAQGALALLKNTLPVDQTQVKS